MKKLAIIFLLIPFSLFSQSNDSLSLDICYKLARDNYPLSKQFDMMASASKLKTKNLDNGNLPQLFVNGQASYR